MSLLSDVKSKLENLRFVPPTETSPSNKEHETSQPTRPKQQQLVLEITSYDRFTPPDPRPDLEYDCRTTLNPPREIRRSHTGLDEEMQSELMNRDEFSDMASRAESEIRKLMEVSDARTKDEDDVAIVRVGCLCGSGHHRSVAFAEQLKKVAWPSEWDVRVRHRDLTNRVEEQKRKHLERRRKDEAEQEEAHQEHRHV